MQNIAIVFDASVFAIFGAFLNGLTLYPIQKDKLLDFEYFENFIKENKINILNFTVSFFNKLIEFNPNIFDKSRVILIGGEAVLPKTVNILRKVNPKVEIVNVYGPTENSDLSSCHIIEKDYNLSVPIGKPVSNSTCYILDKNENLLPFKTPGEIYVGGDGVAIGYLNNKKLTDEKFIKNKFGEGKLYKTGDLGYWEEEGIIQFISRLDKQVKIRGFRIELKEIEAKILEFDNVQECAVIVIEGNNSKLLVACVAGKNKIDTKKLNEYLKNKLPFYMVPSKYVYMPSLPLNINGKLDTKKIIQDLSFDSEEIVKPKNKLQEKLLNIWESVLEIKQIGINQNFFEIGGDSLSAINLINLINSEFNTQINMNILFDNSTIEDLSLYMSNNSIIKETDLLQNISKSNSYCVSSAQKRIFYSMNMDSDNSILYNVPGGIIFNKTPDIKKLEKCFNTLIERHESLRTCFELNDGKIIQKVNENVNFKLELCNKTIEYSSLKEEFNQFVKPFNLSKAPLFRAKLYNLTNNSSALFVDMHHIICDGTSVAIIINELCKLYNGEKLDKIEITYKDYAKWENDKLENGEFNRHEEYWVNQFKSDIPVLNMPTNYTRPAIRSFIGNKIHSQIDSSLTDQINKICLELKTTPFMLLLSIYFVLLYKYTNQEDIVVGSPIVGRSNSKLNNVVGMFVNTLPIRPNIDSNFTFKEFLQEIKNLCINNYKYQDYPFDELVNQLNIPRDTSRNPLFDTMFIYQNNGNTDIKFNNINAEYYIPDTKISKFDLSLEIIPNTNGLDLSFEYCTKLFDKSFIESLSEHYLNIIKTILENIDIKISDINMLSKKEKNKILYDFNNTTTDYPKDKTISTLFEEQVEKAPDNIAIVFENQKLTYKELNEKANSLAYYLRNNCKIERNDIIGIMVNRSLEMIISILAVLKAGSSYMPIDPDYPQDRIEYMLKNSNSKLLLTFKNLDDRVLFDNKIFVELSNPIYKENKQNIENINKPDDLSYIIYTSGSTGMPKGVMLKHSSLTSLTNYLNNYVDFLKNKNEQKTIVSVTTVSFDIFIFETLICLQKGLKIVIATEEEQHIPTKLISLIKKENIEIMQMTPSRMQLFLDNNDCDNLYTLKYIVLAGEALPDALLSKLLSLGIKKVYNGYGPSETTVFSTFTDVTNQSHVNIGKPLDNTKVYILDKNMNICPLNVPGELYIAGIGVGLGYLNNKELTNKTYIKNPFEENSIMYKTGDLCVWQKNSEIQYLGRVDNQIKIRGLRIELGEVENAIAKYPGIKKVCVIKQTIDNRDFLSAYFIQNKRINIAKLREHLSQFLPKYMIPSYFTVLDDFTYTPNGKIDKKALPLPKEILNNEIANTYKAPKTEIEKELVAIWEDVLNISPIGINDNFFELGGDSVLAMNLNIELRKKYNSINYADIFKYPTITGLIKKINTKNENYDFKYMEKNYEKYSELLNNTKVPSIFKLQYNNPGNVLLTGATGFLGMHILGEFIDKEKGNVYCIVRNEPGLTAQAKLYQKLNYYFGNKYDKYLGKRIFAITGDISASGFGLNQEELLNIANNISTVINTAARVSHYGNYSDFYNTNVKSVMHLIEFCKSFNKKLYHVSTLSVSGNSFDSSIIKQDFEETKYFSEKSLYIGQSLENVYVRSKFEAECLILDGILNGLDAYILRVGNLMPRLKDGVFQENISENAYVERICEFIKIGLIPDTMLDGYLEFTPIDSISNAIIKLITHPNKNFRMFHLFDHNHVYINKCIKYFKILNPKLNVLNENDFSKNIKKILNNKKQKNNLKILINDMDKDLHLMYKSNIIIKSDNTIKYLSKIGFIWPKINDKYMIRFLEVLRKVL